MVPGVTYIRTEAYKARFGDNSGRWLVVTTGDVRMKHLLKQTGQVLGSHAGIFLFTTFDRITAGNILTSAIWWQVGKGRPCSLFTN